MNPAYFYNWAAQNFALHLGIAIWTVSVLELAEGIFVLPFNSVVMSEASLQVSNDVNVFLCE